MGDSDEDIDEDGGYNSSLNKSLDEEDRIDNRQ